MDKRIRTVLLIIVFVGVLLSYKVVRAEHIVDCNASYDIKTFAQCKVSEKWDSDQWKAFDYIINKESGWKSNAQNSKSTAFGLGQFLDSTWETVGYEKTSDPQKQILATIKYIDQRYETPAKAKAFHIKNNHY